MKFCESAPCHVMGGRQVWQTLQNELKLQSGETSEDSKWTLVTPCRVGAQRSYEILTRSSHGQGNLSDLDELKFLGENMEALSNCGLGQTASTPVRDLLKHFRAEVEAHTRLGVCSTGVCPMVAPANREYQKQSNAAESIAA